MLSIYRIKSTVDLFLNQILYTGFIMDGPILLGIVVVDVIVKISDVLVHHPL